IWFEPFVPLKPAFFELSFYSTAGPPAGVGVSFMKFKLLFPLSGIIALVGFLVALGLAVWLIGL
ncbi:MAG TPA: hypothetical protein VE616_02660, partial [Candidatus Udaeobacter sp.]|nr:hypothetical protein [Candidatus Udaeobacter sp.]